MLFINRVYPPVAGATGRVLRDLAQAFAESGWDVTVVTSGRRRGRELDGTIRVIRVKGPERPRGIFSYMVVWVKLFLVALRLPARNLTVTMT